ncbi:cytochrome [Streptomyces fodineus]|uniref:Cytochrome n=1 Tax=Streptomyces fodineus TaxID=1904616 RepID=A0A1D7Y6Q2_9ACTN|nr:cytochrome P450 [Streptomyces fodineus]AOR31275.1 cytochrome [Streptomyces fodineus]
MTATETVQATHGDLDAVDLTDPRTFVPPGPGDLHDLWQRFRTERPVHHHRPTAGRPGFWALTRYADVLAVYKDNDRFTSERGNVLATLLQGGDSAAGKMLAVTDGSRHRAIRNLMLRSFSPRALHHVVEQVRTRTRDLLAQVLDRDGFDYAEAIAEHIPMGTICDLMAVPPQDRQPLLDWNKQVLSADSSDGTAEDAWLARNEILLYFSDLARSRRRTPGDDVISALATGEIDGRPLTEEEIVLNCYSLIIGGDESSRMASIGAVLGFLEHPGQWRAFKAGEVGVDSATEEVLRWTTPAMHFGRRALVDVEIGGRTIPAGDVVTLWNSSANFDESVFADPRRYDLGRTPNKHVTFGFGPHFCLGAFLGREELKALLAALRDLVAAVESRGPARRVYSNFLYGYSSLPVAFTAA